MSIYRQKYVCHTITRSIGQDFGNVLPAQRRHTSKVNLSRYSLTCYIAIQINTLLIFANKMFVTSKVSIVMRCTIHII